MILHEVESISSITTLDQVQILATFNVLHEPSYQCGICKKKVSEENRINRKGCIKSLPTAFSSWRNLVKFRKCPANFYSTYWAMTIDNYRQYERGILPFKGSLLDQPSKIIEAYSFIENLKLEHENEIRERFAKSQKRK